MEEFIERVSDILRSPVILKRWQVSYRHSFSFCLVILVIFSSAALAAEDSQISRYSFVLAVYERVFNRSVTEIEASESGLIDEFDDGQYNLDWPISRGMAAEAFYRLSLQLGTVAKVPRAFADIGNDSVFKKPLEKVGGAFLPRTRGRFDPNYLLDRETLFRAINILLEKGVLRQEDRSRLSELPQADPITTISPDTLAVTADQTAFVPIHPDLGFKEHQGTDNRYRADTYNRVAMANNRINIEQMSPQAMSSIEDAGAAMKDVEALLSRLGGSVMEMTEAHPSNPDDERDLREGLAKIEGVLADAIDRFNFSKLQLSTTMPVDPDQIRRCTELNQQLSVQLERLTVLRQRIADRLAEPQKEEN